MIIFIKNKYTLQLDEFKFKCCIGKKGFSINKKEGDKCTPRGRFKLKYFFYRKERVKKIHSKLKTIPIKKNYGWCDDIQSKLYNKFIKFPFKGGAERLYIKVYVYDIIVVINYNINPVKKKRGSAIFLHVAKKNYEPTLGCIALSKKDLKYLLSIINKETFLKIL